MHVTIVYIRVKPEHVSEFIAATRRNHEGAVQEAGNRRFDVIQDANDPTRFVLYEAYLSAADAAAHKETPHYHAWAQAVTPWLAAPRERAQYKGLFPPG